MLTHDYIDSCRTAYRGANSTLEWEDPSLSPLFADLRGLPPTLIQVGTNEILKSDSINLAKAMTEQEVYAVLEVYPECWHVFQQMPIPPCRTGHGKRWPLCAENFVTAEPRRIGGLPFARNLV